MKKSCFLFFLLCISFVSRAQFPKTFPEDGLDANVSISFCFYKNESQSEKQEFMNKFVGFALDKGFNVVTIDETSLNMTEVEKAEYKKKSDSLQIKYTITPVQHPMSNFIFMTRTLDAQSKRYTDRASFQKALDLFVKDVDQFKSTHPEANKAAFENKLLDLGSDSSSVSDITLVGADFNRSYVYIDQLPKDLSSQTLLVMIYNDFVSPEDSALMSSEALIKRKKYILQNIKMNDKVKEIFKEYPYPVLYVYEKELKELTKKYRYQLVDNQRLVNKVVPRSASGAVSGFRVKSVRVHNYCIVDHRESEIYYRLPSWEDCDKELENGCLKHVVKSILKKESK